METKILLPEKEMPHQWYNVLPDLPFELPPPMHPGTKKPLVADDLRALFPMELIKQEMSSEVWIDIPDEVLKIYHLWRPTPLKRARRLEQLLKTTCRIYYKDESVSPSGSHKTNTAIPQAYYNKKAGIKRI
ncbi:MAG: TrpB-like pyridoxal-phosphate dependent enzyme, partial [Deltaproteobacteria bacterium]